MFPCIDVDLKQLCSDVDMLSRGLQSNSTLFRLNFSYKLNKKAKDLLLCWLSLPVLTFATPLYDMICKFKHPWWRFSLKMKTVFKETLVQFVSLLRHK